MKRTPEPMSYTRAGHLLNPVRGLILSPGQLLDRLHLHPDSVVLELGPGPGYFSPAVAKAVPEGTLMLVDVQQEMLDMAKERIDKAGIGNVQYRNGDATSLPAENGTFDVVFLAAMLGEVSDRDACLQEIHRVLKPEGLLSVTEYKLGDPDFIPDKTLANMLQAAGFRVSDQYGGVFHYTINSVKCA